MPSVTAMLRKYLFSLVKYLVTRNLFTNCRYRIRPVGLIIVSFTILFSAMWVVVGFSIINTRQQVLAAAQLEAHNLMIAFREEVTLILGQVERETDLLAERMRREPDFDLHAWGQENSLSPGIRQATIIGPDGNLKSTTSDPPFLSTYFGDREHFRVHLDGRFKGLFIGPTVFGRTARVPILPISRRVEAADGTFLGVLVILISPSVLTTLHKTINLGPHGVMTLAGLDNLILARCAADSPDGTVGLGTSVGVGKRPTAIGERAEGLFTRPGIIDGITRLFVYGRVGNYPLVVTVGLETNQALAAWRSYAETIFAIALGATLLMTALAAYLVREIRFRAAHEVKLQATNAALTESVARAEASSRSKSQFLANMSHELRTPLNAVLGFAELLMMDFSERPNSRQRGYIQNIQEGGTLLLCVINDILDIAQVSAGKLKLREEADVDIRRIADTSISLVKELANVGEVCLSLETEDRVPLLIADPIRLKQILLNLLSNAVKFTPPGGSVILAIRRVEDGIVVEVKDTGIGMTAAEIEIALQPFGQVDGGLARQHAGTGLGLPIAQQLAELHGGSLQVESEKGRGTTITVLLPAARIMVDTGSAAIIQMASYSRA